MTKPRDICSIRAGLHKALGAIDEAHIERATGKSASLYRKCADPDNARHRLQAEDALAIDMACVAAGERPFILESYRQALDARIAETIPGAAHRPMDPMFRISEAMRDLGRVAETIADAARPKGMSAEDAQRCALQIDRTLDTLSRLKLDLRAIVRVEQEEAAA
ncbi:MAG: hypothetical protein GC202_02305 [Alphaproteobacteria bacterium]|nr:hypothetical protein [Alphaproteobacteria bacterium]